MCFLALSFDAGPGLQEMYKALSALEFFSFCGDWHEHRLNAVRIAGLSFDCAPARSILADQSQSGPAYHVRLTFENGAEMDGQLRSTALLLCNKALPADSILSSLNVQLLIACIRMNSINVRVEVG